MLSVLMIACATATVHAVPAVSLSPSSQTVPDGSITTVDLNVAGLVDGSPDTLALGGFDFTFTYNPLVLTPLTPLIDPNNELGIGLTSVDLSYAGNIVFKLSFEASADLLANQADAFILAQLKFLAVDPGLSLLDLDVTYANALSDQDANSLNFDFTGGSITVEASTPPPPGVPDGGATAAMLAIALGGMFGVRKLAGKAK